MVECTQALSQLNIQASVLYGAVHHATGCSLMTRWHERFILWTALARGTKRDLHLICLLITFFVQYFALDIFMMMLEQGNPRKVFKSMYGLPKNELSVIIYTPSCFFNTSMSSMITKTVWVPTFFKISSFTFRRRTKGLQVGTIWGWVNDDRFSFPVQ